MRSSVTFELKGNLKSPGFRPFIWRIVSEAHLGGWAAETPDGAVLRLDGEDEEIGDFIRSLPAKLPRSLSLTAIRLAQKTAAPAPSAEPRPFKILGPVLYEAHVEADRAPCPDCIRKMLDPESPSYHYPFVSCAKCGPRYSVQTLSPFNRHNSAFMAFPPCKECAGKIHDSEEQKGNPNQACPFCGPSALLMDRSGSIVDSYSPLETACDSLQKGGILSVKANDGFITLCNALDNNAILELRRRKKLFNKPVSIMARDIEIVKKYCYCSEEEEKLLTSPAAPVVILKPLPGIPLATANICPDYPETMGVALPPTAMLRLLFESRPTPDSLHGQFDLFAFVGGPKPVDPDDAGGDEDFNAVAAYSDYILNHDLKIWQNSGSSVMSVLDGKPITWRRSRGICPTPVKLHRNLRRVAIALGSDHSSAVALGYRNSVAVSQQMGTILNDRNARSLSLVGERFLLLFAQVPDIVVCDMDVNALSAREALRFSEKYSLPLATAQRHHANAIACMVEHGLDNALAFVFDGGAYGPDGLTWGAEMMEITFNSFSRLASFAPMPSPVPERGEFSDPQQLFLLAMERLKLPVGDELLKRLNMTRELYESGRESLKENNTQKTHAALPLFKAVGAALSLLPFKQTYDNQIMIRMESALSHLQSRENAERLVPRFGFQLRDDDGLMVIDWTETFRNLADPSWYQEIPQAELVMAFLLAVGNAVGAMAEYAAGKTSRRQVVLSGTAFLSPSLTKIVRESLTRRGFTVYTHEKTSPDESSVCIGQAVFGGMS